jgi:hypothetical protein
MKRATFRHPSMAKHTLAAVAAAALLAGSVPAHAAGWGFNVTPYLWATGIGVDAQLDGREVVSKDIPVSDLIQDLDTVFQMRMELTYGPFGLAADGFDVTLSSEKAGMALPQDAGTTDLDNSAGMTIVDVAGTFDPYADRKGFGLLAGTRIVNERANVDAVVRPASGGSVAQSYETHETLVDGLIGARFRHRLWRGLGVQMQADASTGGTDYTWSVAPSLTYAFGPLGRFGVEAGYRRMQIDFQDDGGLDTQMSLSGAVLGFRFSF